MAKKLITISQIGFRIGDAATATLVDCVGKLEYTVGAIVKEKPCGLTKKIVAVMNTGAGKVNIDCHADGDDYDSMLGMKDTAKSSTVNRWGDRRPTVCVTAYGEDESGDKVVVAFPEALITADEVSDSIDNSATDIAYMSMAFEYGPDSNKIGMYKKDEDDLPTGKTVANWMSVFDADTMYA